MVARLLEPALLIAVARNSKGPSAKATPSSPLVLISGVCLVDATALAWGDPRQSAAVALGGSHLPQLSSAHALL
jgi:hypothetical protein